MLTTVAILVIYQLLTDLTVNLISVTLRPIRTDTKEKHGSERAKRKKHEYPKLQFSSELHGYFSNILPYSWFG